MMNPVLLVPLVACVLAAMIAVAIVSHDPSQRANRLAAAVLACSAWWSLCEVLWNVQDDPQVAMWLIRASSLGWLWLGPLALDFFTELVADARSRLNRVVPFAYGATAVSIVVYIATPWCIAEAVRTDWGWGYRFGPYFPVVYSLTLSCVGLVLLNFPGLLFRGAGRERRVALLMLLGLVVPMTVASSTDVVLPYLGIHVPRLGSASLLVMGSVVAWSVRRHGSLLLTPGAFASEILGSLRDGVALLRPDGRIRTCNPALAQLAGRASVELRDRPFAELLPDLPRRDEEALHDLEIELRPCEGAPIPVSVSSSILRDAKEMAVGEVFVVHDLREVAALRNRLVTSGRLAAVGELAAGIAHEIANPVSFVRTNLRELRRHWETLEEAADEEFSDRELARVLAEGEELIEESVEGVDRVAGIVRNVGAFSHAGVGSPEPVDLNELLDNVLSVAVLGASVVVERCYSLLPPVSCDPQQLKQVFLNLLLNALQAVGDRGRVRLVSQASGSWVRIRVEDDGPGIPDDEIERVFDPFFTTRPAEGVGLGLAHSHEITRAHGGSISVSSSPGIGTAFEVRLPAMAPS